MPLSPDSLSKDALVAQAVATLRAANTIAGVRVYDPNTIPVQVTTFPALNVSAPSERKEAYGGPGGTPKFDSTIALAVMARVDGSGGSNEARQQSAQTLLDQLASQVELALLCAPAMLQIVQQFVFVESHGVVNAAGETFVGEATIIIGCQVWQHYLPDAGAPLTEFVTTIPASGSAPPVTIDSTIPPTSGP